MKREALNRLSAGTYATRDGRYEIERVQYDTGEVVWNLVIVDKGGHREWCQTFPTKRDAVDGLADCRAPSDCGCNALEYCDDCEMLNPDN
jgi:hypothetical protein